MQQVPICLCVLVDDDQTVVDCLNNLFCYLVFLRTCTVIVARRF